jgi:predicted nucleotidyltransferase
MTRAELLERLRELKPWLAEQGVENLRLFGSFARDEARPDSDVDLLMTTSRDIGLKQFDIARELGEALGRKIDLCEETQLVNPYVRHHAFKDAVAI